MKISSKKKTISKKKEQSFQDQITEYYKGIDKKKLIRNTTSLLALGYLGNIARKNIFIQNSLSNIKSKIINITPFLKKIIGDDLDNEYFLDTTIYDNVVKAVRIKDSKKVVIKIIELPYTMDLVGEDIRDTSIKTEISNLKSLTGEFSPKYITHKFSNKKLYIIFEDYYITPTLPLKDKDALFKIRVVNNILNGLKFLHDHSISHNNINENNILVDPETEKIKFVNFSYSCYKSCSKDIPVSMYNPPEKIKSGYKGDVWATGVLIFQILFEKYPFNIVNKKIDYESIKGILEDTKQNDKKFNDFLDKISKMLEIYPENRPTISTIIYPHKKPGFLSWFR
jgi:serine/threonine protein kinase